MMLGKDYMLAIVIVNYEGRCIFTELAGSWTVVLEFECCLSMHVSVSSYMGRKFISIMTSSAETVWFVHAVLVCPCWCACVVLSAEKVCVCMCFAPEACSSPPPLAQLYSGMQLHANRGYHRLTAT